MVFIMIADIVCESIQRPIVRVCLCRTIHYVMLREKVASCGMDGASKESGEQEIKHDLQAEEINQGSIKCNLHCPICCQERIVVRHDLRLDSHRSKCICENLAEHEDCLAKCMINIAQSSVSDHITLQAARNVRVNIIVSLVAVVLHVVRLESDTIRDANRQVGHHGDELVLPSLFRT